MAVKGVGGIGGDCGIISDIESVAFMGHSIQWATREHGKSQCRCLLLLNGAYDLYFILFSVFFFLFFVDVVFALMLALYASRLN